MPRYGMYSRELPNRSFSILGGKSAIIRELKRKRKRCHFRRFGVTLSPVLISTRAGRSESEEIFAEGAVRITRARESTFLQDRDQFVGDPGHIFRSEGPRDEKSVAADEAHDLFHLIRDLFRGTDQRLLVGEAAHAQRDLPGGRIPRAQPVERAPAAVGVHVVRQRLVAVIGSEIDVGDGADEGEPAGDQFVRDVLEPKPVVVHLRLAVEDAGKDQVENLDLVGRSALFRSEAPDLVAVGFELREVAGLCQDEFGVLRGEAFAAGRDAGLGQHGPALG